LASLCGEWIGEELYQGDVRDEHSLDELESIAARFDIDVDSVALERARETVEGSQRVYEPPEEADSDPTAASRHEREQVRELFVALAEDHPST
jgi:hypothetical protein